MLQIILGGWTSTNYSAAYCTEFPGCTEGEAWPAMDFEEAFWIDPPALPEQGDWEGGAMNAEARRAIHMSHRLLAAVVTIALLVVLIWVRFCPQTTRWQGTISIIVLVLLAVQVSIGIATAYAAKYGMPVKLGTLHNLGAAVLLCSLLWLNFSLRYELPRGQTTP